jgi:hypothetical protein
LSGALLVNTMRISFIFIVAFCFIDFIIFYYIGEMKGYIQLVYSVISS